MTQEPTVVPSEPESSPAAHVVHTVMQLALAVRHRKQVMIAALVACSLLGGLYYMTATRYYSAQADLLVLHVGNDPLSSSSPSQGNWQQTLLPTLQSLFGKAKVIEGAFPLIPREARVDFTDQPRDKWVEIVRRNLSVNLPRRENFLRVSYRSKDPHAAVTVVNAIVDSYLDYVNTMYQGTAGEDLEVLKAEFTKVERDLNDKQRQRITAVQRAQDLAIGAESRTVHPLVQRAITAAESLQDAEDQRRELEVMLARIQQANRNGESLQNCLAGIGDQVGEAMLRTLLGISDQDASVQAELEKALAESRAEREGLRKLLGTNHPDMLALEDAIRTREEALGGYWDRVARRATTVQGSEMAPALIEMVHQRLLHARKLEQSCHRAYDLALKRAVSHTGQLMELDDLNHNIEWLRKYRDTLRDQLANVNVRRDGREIQAVLVEEPKVNLAPVSPSLARTIFLVLLCGGVLGLGLVYVLDTLADRFRSVEEMQSRLGVPILAMIRELDTGGREGIEAVQTHVAPNAPECEAFRTLRTALSFADHDTSRLVVSSPEPSDGKTTVLANLAATIAQNGKRTLLIDADLRRPGLTALLGMRGIDGLSTVIRADDDLVGMVTGHIRPSGLENLDVLPSGPRPANPAELLGDQRFSELLAWAETVYDQVLIDSPPALVTSDTAVIGRLVDGVVLVVQPAKNRRRLVTRAAESFSMLKIPLLGVVVNRIDFQKDGAYYGYGGYYGYGYGGTPEDEDDLDAPDHLVSDLGEPDPEVESYRRHDEPHTPTPIIPRRVARSEGTGHPHE
ncbi:MAG: polysaccharide biosynthesis tyrosine autokinase [Planctomycetota bacterium]|jgi:capsular exopolysaccharide synthesis family protein